MDNSGDYEFDEYSSVVKFRTLPSVLDEFIHLCERVAANPGVPEHANLLIDLRSAARLFQFDEIYEFVAWHKAQGFPFKGRFAFLVDRPATIGTANIYCSLLQLQSVEAEMFDAESAAMTWLATAPRVSGAYVKGAAHDADESADVGRRSAARG